jgi:DNA-directed RNA polymerase subunit RPC12/RpoP
MEEENHYKHYDKERKLYHYKCSKCKKEVYSWCTDAVGMKCAWCINQMKPVLK